MSVLGQTRSFGDVRGMSALHLITIVTRTLREFAFGRVARRNLTPGRSQIRA